MKRIFIVISALVIGAAIATQIFGSAFGDSRTTTAPLWARILMFVAITASFALVGGTAGKTISDIAVALLPKKSKPKKSKPKKSKKH